jgi:hypothetical protein
LPNPSSQGNAAGAADGGGDTKESGLSAKSRHAPHRTHRQSRGRGALAGLLAFLLVAVVAGVAGRERIADVAGSVGTIGAACPDSRLDSTVVTVMVAPELTDAARAALRPLATRRLDGGECVSTQVEPREPIDTVQSSDVLPLDRAGDIWIPDSSLWMSRTPNWPMRPAGSFASSPVVIASSRPVIQALGWDTAPPTWRAAVAGRRPLAVPEIGGSAPGLLSVIAMWQALGKGPAAQQALAGAVLAAGRADIPTEAEAIDAADSGSAQAPLLPTFEQEVAQHPAMVAVHPTDGNPRLDYPILTRGGNAPDTDTRYGRAVTAVVDQLRSAAAAKAVQQAGFAPALPGTPAPAAPDAAPVAAAGLPSPVEVAGLVQRITMLSAPSRILVTYDLSPSMASQTPIGLSRIDLAAQAARLAGDLMPDRAQVGLWGFSRDLNGPGTQDAVSVQAVAPLGSRDGKRDHRAAVYLDMAKMRGRLGGNGTALYSTAVKGMRAMQKLYQPGAGNALVVFTDGADDNPGGPTLEQAKAAVAKIHDPRRPVRLILIGIGPELQMPALTEFAAAGGGTAFQMKDPRELPTVLFKVMNSRPS